jgi:hypothetical protein
MFFIHGCGYKATKHYAKEQLHGNIFYTLDMNINNVEQSVVLRNEIISMILNDLDSTIAKRKEDADTYIEAHIASIDYKGIKTDNEGYTKIYRTTVSVKLIYQKKESLKKQINSSGYYDYVVDTDSTITEQNKLESIRIATQNALDHILSKLAISSL